MLGTRRLRSDGRQTHHPGLMAATGAPHLPPCPVLTEPWCTSRVPWRHKTGGTWQPERDAGAAGHPSLSLDVGRRKERRCGTQRDTCSNCGPEAPAWGCGSFDM